MDSNFDIVPTLRMFDGVMMGKAADEIEALRKEVTALRSGAAPATAAHAGATLTDEQVAALRVAADALIEKYAKPIRDILAACEIATAPTPVADSGATLKAVAAEYDALIRHMDAGGDFYAFQSERIAASQTGDKA